MLPKVSNNGLVELYFIKIDFNIGSNPVRHLMDMGLGCAAEAPKELKLLAQPNP